MLLACCDMSMPNLGTTHIPKPIAVAEEAVSSIGLYIYINIYSNNRQPTAIYKRVFESLYIKRRQQGYRICCHTRCSYD